MAEFINYGKAYSRVVDLYSLIPKHLFGNGYAFPPLQVLLEVTYRCNYRCSMCQFNILFKDHRLKGTVDNELKLQEIENLVNQLNSKMVVTITGGEPFIRSDIMEIIEICSKKTKCHIITNGFALDEEKITKLLIYSCKSIVSKGLLFIDFSIQGPEGIHDKISGVPNSFGRVIDNIKFLQKEKKRLRKKYPLVNLKTVITPDSAPYLSKMYDIAGELGADVYSFIICNGIESNFLRFEFFPDTKGIDEIKTKDAPIIKVDTKILKTEFDKIKKASEKSRVQVRFSPLAMTFDEAISFHDGNIDLSKYNCNAPWTKLFISAYGDIMSCFNRTVGNIRKDQLKDIWMHPVLKDLRSGLEKSKGIFPACIGCCQSEFKG
jgi:MoaA/NifB/PqqE/SkfB family radical SAM enzyme